MAGEQCWGRTLKNEIDIIRDVSARLERMGIPFMITGSIAMNYYAEPRMTRDIDLVVEITAGDIQGLVDGFADDYYVERSAVEGAVACSSMFNLLHLESVIKVDFIVRKASAYRRVEFGRRRRITIEGFSTSIVSIEDLILSKLEWAKDSHSELQLRDVRNLLASSHDRAYVQQWAQDLGLTDLLRESGGE